MKCKYCDEYTGVCTNADCPMVADACPVPDLEGVCKYENREEVAYMLTPKGCAIAALIDAGLIGRVDDPRTDSFWDAFSMLMEKNGYIQEAQECQT